MIIVGIDIGVTGAVAALDGRGGCDIEELPTRVIPGGRKVKRRLDPVGLANILRRMVPPGVAAMVVIEDVHTYPSSRNNPQSQGSLMHSRGMIEAVVELARFKLVAVEPPTWKRFCGLLGEGKTASRDVACKLYPAAEPLLCRAKDHNRAEALLIAHFGLRKLA